MNGDKQLFFIEKNNFTRIVGEQIRKYREEQSHISQETLGELTNYDRTYIGSIERGEKMHPFMQSIKYCLLLKLTLLNFLIIFKEIPYGCKRI